jgi:hypothetical protein
MTTVIDYLFNIGFLIISMILAQQDFKHFQIDKTYNIIAFILGVVYHVFAFGWVGLPLGITLVFLPVLMEKMKFKASVGGGDIQYIGIASLFLPISLSLFFVAFCALFIYWTSAMKNIQKFAVIPYFFITFYFFKILEVLILW